MITHVIPCEEAEAETALAGDRRALARAMAPEQPAGVNCGRHGPFCVPLHLTSRCQGARVDLREIETLIARFAPYSEEREQFSAALYGTSEVLKIDGEGRAILTEPLKSHAGIKDEMAFAGLGHKFQIWEPGRFRAELAEATEKVRALKKQLGTRVSADGPHGARE
jgi:MraZ protein